MVEGSAQIEELNLTINPGQLMGEIAIFAPNKKRTQSIRCSQDCLFLRISEEKVLQLYSENPEFGLFLIKMIVDRLLTNSSNRPVETSQ